MSRETIDAFLITKLEEILPLIKATPPATIPLKLNALYALLAAHLSGILLADLTSSEILRAHRIINPANKANLAFDLLKAELSSELQNLIAAGTSSSLSSRLRAISATIGGMTNSEENFSKLLDARSLFERISNRASLAVSFTLNTTSAIRQIVTNQKNYLLGNGNTALSIEDRIQAILYLPQYFYNRREDWDRFAEAQGILAFPWLWLSIFMNLLGTLYHSLIYPPTSTALARMAQPTVEATADRLFSLGNQLSTQAKQRLTEMNLNSEAIQNAINSLANFKSAIEHGAGSIPTRMQTEIHTIIRQLKAGKVAGFCEFFNRHKEATTPEINATQFTTIAAEDLSSLVRLVDITSAPSELRPAAVAVNGAMPLVTLDDDPSRPLLGTAARKADDLADDATLPSAPRLGGGR